MSLRRLRVTQLRCLEQAEILPSPGINLIAGANGSGKTSLLEAIYLLGRGRSFRAPRAASVIATNESSAVIFAELNPGEELQRLGVEIQRQGIRRLVNGEADVSVAELAAALPVQLIDPQVHDLVQGGPGERREFVDWGMFHVKHEFLPAWRRYRRALRQRNAALKMTDSNAMDSVAAWDDELNESGMVVDTLRRQYIEEITPIMASKVEKILQMDLKVDYQSGWSATASLAEALAAGLDRDRALGSTQHGPHRAEIVIQVDGEAARHRLSRGQQKLLAAALVLAQNDHVQSCTGRNTLLLVDEPAAELDDHHLHQLVEAVHEAPAQVFITALSDTALASLSPDEVFHVKRGEGGILV